MNQPQEAIFRNNSRAHYALEYVLKPEVADAALRAGVQSAIRRAGSLKALVAFGPALWSRLAPDHGLADFEDFQAISGSGYHAPATQRDMLVWCHAAGDDDCFDAVMAMHDVLAPICDPVLEQRGFTYHDSRDLTGFIDGTANPKGDKALEAALVQPAGGSFVLTQKWVHDLSAFKALDVGEQEKVIGRTKADSIEFEGDAMPPNAHVARNDLPGTKIFRRSFPYGSAVEKGLYFLAFTCEIKRYATLLGSMYDTAGSGTCDRLLDFSVPVTGAYWYAPGTDELAAL